ncbi:hypothetical protein CRG98_024253 [Punica granatum]|uniref:Uncharacterized protein n=1 Tax=Punica granatum TaxID=22663 RepID=A0A2I0JH74_PUNGR|nr:hypothetical protein CRG98_024253 [Punica granatum]
MGLVWIHAPYRKPKFNRCQGFKVGGGNRTPRGEECRPLRLLATNLSAQGAKARAFEPIDLRRVKPLQPLRVKPRGVKPFEASPRVEPLELQRAEGLKVSPEDKAPQSEPGQGAEAQSSGHFDPLTIEGLEGEVMGFDTLNDGKRGRVPMSLEGIRVELANL